MHPFNYNHIEKYNQASLISANPSFELDILYDNIPPFSKEKQEYEVLLKDYIDKDFLMGRIDREKHPLFIKVDKEHTQRNIYLLASVYEAYIKMHNAALSDGIKLKITSGHRTFIEQVYEWELRWNNPKTDRVFANDTEKARHVLEYRSMPGTSRHHWGTDIDLNSFKLEYFKTKEGIKMYDWMKENANKYGFYQSYTARDENRPTGYNEEKWHWSYYPIAQIMLSKYGELVNKDDIHGFKGDGAVKELEIISEWVYGIDPSML